MLVGGKTTPLKHMKVSWDDDIPNIWKKKHVPNHQSAYVVWVFILNLGGIHVATIQ
jgi:hypothetical protein